MLDQYPVPFMPMTWLSDCMGECFDKLRGSGRLAAVIQAFGGERWKDLGWSRLPAEREMGCLAFLSVVNGARGIFFYTYGVMGRTEQGRGALGRVVGRLNQVYPWLVVENSAEAVMVEMISENRFDPKGRPAVQCCLKRKAGELMVMAVNVIGTGVEVLLTGEPLRGLAGERVREVFSGEDYRVRDGNLRLKLGAYGVKAFLFGG